MPKVFISYGRGDAGLADALRLALLRVGIEPWIDTADVPPGYPIGRAIRDGIHAADLLLVLVSPASLASKWVEEELSLAAGCQLSNIGVKVLPCLLPGMSAEDLPAHLRGINAIAADAGVPAIVRSVQVVLDAQPTRVFSGPERGRYNVDYYRYLNARLSEATREIWITGTGFSCEGNPEGRVRADEMLAALEGRLRHNVQVFRVQTGASLDPHWAQELLRLVTRYPTLMKLWRIQEQHDFVSLAAIDPANNASSVAEIMLSDQRNDDPLGDYASVATFVRRDPATAQIIRSRIRQMTESRRAYQVVPAADALAQLMGRVYYFAYGSNMNEAQMQRRAGNDAQRVEVGRLAHHAVVLGQLSDRYTDGAVATIVPAPHAEVLGVIWHVHWSTIVALDADEGPDLYRRQEFDVVGLSGHRVRCHAYVGLVPSSRPASRTYVAKLVAACEAADLPLAYIQSVRSQVTSE